MYFLSIVIIGVCCVDNHRVYRTLGGFRQTSGKRGRLEQMIAPAVAGRACEVSAARRTAQKEATIRTHAGPSRRWIARKEGKPNDHLQTAVPQAVQWGLAVFTPIMQKSRKKRTDSLHRRRKDTAANTEINTTS